MPPGHPSIPVCRPIACEDTPSITFGECPAPEVSVEACPRVTDFVAEAPAAIRAEIAELKRDWNRSSVAEAQRREVFFIVSAVAG